MKDLNAHTCNRLVFAKAAQIPPDLRAYAQALLTSLPSQLLIPYIHPTFYSLHNMPPEVRPGFSACSSSNHIFVKMVSSFTSERLERFGLFLIEDGQTIFLWVSCDAVPQLVLDVFNLLSYHVLQGGKVHFCHDLTLRRLTDTLTDNSACSRQPFSQCVNAIVQKTREMQRRVYHLHLYVVKEDGEPPLRLWALSCLIQDCADMLPSYQQFITQLKDKVCVGA
jgi:protein transport protein SEC24